MMRALTVDDLRCPQTGKRAYVDEATALENVGKVWEMGQNLDERHGRMPKAAYQCEHCGWWHMTAKHPDARAVAS